MNTYVMYMSNLFILYLSVSAPGECICKMDTSLLIIK